MGNSEQQEKNRSFANEHELTLDVGVLRGKRAILPGFRSAYTRDSPSEVLPLDAHRQVEEELAGSPFDGAQMAQALEPENLAGFPQMARALRNPNFRLFWSGNFLSNIGTWMQNVAQGWLVLLLTNSAFWLGVVGFAGSIPFLFVSLFGGVVADRVDKRRLLMVTQTAMMVLAFVLAGVAWFHDKNYAWVHAL